MSENTNGSGRVTNAQLYAELRRVDDRITELLVKVERTDQKVDDHISSSGHSVALSQIDRIKWYIIATGGVATVLGVAVSKAI